MRTNIGTGIVAGILAAVAYGLVVQLATTPVMDGAPMAGSGMNGDSMAAPTAPEKRVPMILMVADMVGSDSLAAAWAILLLVGIAMGGLFAVLFGRRIAGLGAAVGWGILYGALWWVVGGLLFMPIVLGMTPFAPITMATMRFGALIGLGAYLLAGIVLGTVFALVRRKRAAGG